MFKMCSISILFIFDFPGKLHFAYNFNQFICFVSVIFFDKKVAFLIIQPRASRFLITLFRKRFLSLWKHSTKSPLVSCSHLYWLCFRPVAKVSSWKFFHVSGWIPFFPRFYDLDFHRFRINLLEDIK